MVKILVTGATGTNGKKIVSFLIKHGAQVRAAVRDVSKGQPLKDLGAELVQLDWNNKDTYKAAFEGVERALILVPWVENHEQIAKDAVDFAKSAGVKYIVKFSAAGANPNSPLSLPSEHGRSDEHVKQSGLEWTLLQPTFFFDNYVTFHAQSIKSYGVVNGAAGDGKVSYISSSDIANVAAHILINPDKYKGKSIYLTGNESQTDAEFVKVIGDAIGKEIKYISKSPEDYATMLKGYGTPDWVIKGLVGLETIKLNGWASQTNHNVKEITGQEPQSFKDFVQENISAWK